MNHTAIYALYPQVVTIDDGLGAFDADGNLVDIDLEQIAQWVDPNIYKYDRAREYPPIADFADAWVKDDQVALEEYRQKCLAVKAKYPKPQ